MTPQAAGRLGLAASAASFALTFAVAVAGPSLLEPALPGPGGQPPWSFAGHPSPYLMVALTAAAVACGTAGLALTIRASRRGWAVSPLAVLVAGLGAAVLLALVPPFGSADHLSYAAYGRMVTTGHNPYTTTPAALARLGDPVARAVQDWRHSPSVYGSLATGLQALASWIGGTSARLTVFVQSLLNVAAFGGTALLLYRVTRGNRARQLRAALLWAANPLLLQVLIAGAHVDSQAVVFVIAAAVTFTMIFKGYGSGGRGPAASADAGGAGHGQAARLARPLLGGAGAGVLIGLGFAVKLTMALAGLGLALACLVAYRAGRARSMRRSHPGGPVPDDAASNGAGEPRPAMLLAVLVGLGAGFAVTAGAAIAVWGPSSLDPALHAGSYVSIGSPWRAVRSALHPLTGEGIAEDVVKTAAVLVGIGLFVLLVRAFLHPPAPGPDGASGLPVIPLLPERPAGASSAPAPPASAAPAASVPAAPGGAGPAALAGVGGLGWALVLAVAVAWLFAWPYVLPWYDSLGWALLAAAPWSRLDWLLLARTTALAAGYLPARGVALPAGLGWLETVVRTALTPAALLVILVLLVVPLWREWRPRPGLVLASDRPVADRTAPRG
ncbi:MAG TPA: polyprenol phosphomannose-dependent alpha 1,6 mannosyltransferase MptB [Streptosporangiaceae bacterium]